MSSPPTPERLRAQLVQGIASRGRPFPGEPWDPKVLAAIAAVPRHLFAPELDLETAYRDGPQPIGCGQTISQPTVVAMMAQALELEPHHRVLEIGTGSGYHAAVLAQLASSVVSIEVWPELASGARRHLARAGVANVEVIDGDGTLGLPERAPFARILLTAAPPSLPRALVDQLGEGGVLVAPVGETGGAQRLLRARKRHGSVTAEDLGGVLFVPMTHK